ncbi:hypothetical protein BVY02_01205 [bacterium J17]|nr:hypothetical protein BVY02_01205 [bacterium J17]
MKALKIIDRPVREEFSETLGLQNDLVEAKIADKALPDMLVMVEHSDVYTVGRGVEFQVLSDPGKANVPWVEIGRGGQATYHGPGQLVAYPIFDLTQHGSDVHVLLRDIEEAIIICLGEFGIKGIRRDGFTGVWVENKSAKNSSSELNSKLNPELKKIASIGVGVRKWISFHGLALNVTTDLSYFEVIDPCGLHGSLMTSIAEQLPDGRAVPTLVDVKHALAAAFKKVFSFTTEETESIKLKRPNWLKAKAPGSPSFMETRGIVKKMELVTVCEEAHCPNIGECWSHNTATFMIMGELCTRRCSFCAVKDGTITDLQPLNPLEPFQVGRAISELGLKHVVITSVNRDDLEDMGALHFDKVVRAINKQNPDCKIELLIPDMRGRRELVEVILRSGKVSVLNHNIETVPALYRTVRPGAKYQRSLDVLRWAKETLPVIKTKSGLMVGLGETREEVLSVMDELREIDCSILTIGQYLQPTDKQLPVHRFVTPEEFAAYKKAGLEKGFSYVESGPLVRSSYHAWQHTAEDNEAYSGKSSSGEGRSYQAELA